jgi:hypothetical protein
LTTNYAYAVDADNNRAGDRLAGEPSAFYMAYDATPPTAVALEGLATETVGDPSSQFDLTWDASGVGPDDEGDENYPSGYTGNDVLSPWSTYRIYYGPYDPAAPEAASQTDIFNNFVSGGQYKTLSGWTSVVATTRIDDPSSPSTNYAGLATVGTQSNRLYDLPFDQDFVVVIVGVDSAGNEGSATMGSWSTNNTIRFAVTQGLMMARSAVVGAFPENNNLREGDKGAAALHWIAAGPTNAQGGYTQVTKDYDLIYWDAGSFEESSNSVWQRVGTVRTNWFTDATAQDYERGTVRFYRASYKDRWQRTNVVTGAKQRPMASEEVYGLHNVVLSEGFNYVGLHGVPYTNTFGGVFGTDTNFWPVGGTAGDATRVEFYTHGTLPTVTEVYFLGTDQRWYNSGNGQNVTWVQQPSNFFTRGFSITLPTNLVGRGYKTTTAWDFDANRAVDGMVWSPVLQVPTNGPVGAGSYSQVIHTGQTEGRVQTRIYNLVALNLPVSVHPSELNFPTNFTSGAPGVGDEIYTIDTSQKRLRNGSTIYRATSGDWYFFTGGGLVPEGYFKPNDMLVIVSRNGGVGNTWTWTYHPTNFYDLPTRNMGE